MAKLLPRLLPFALCGVMVSRVEVARADFASPPESPYRGPADREPYPRSDVLETPYEVGRDSWSHAQRASLFRAHVGPALLLQPTSPGLFAAIDLGRGAVGGRASATWLRAESDAGLAAYSAELWIDFRHRYQLHPVLGAGASYLRGGALDEETSAGAGLLRGALEYELPVSDADARVGVDVMLFVPAIGIERTRPWASAALTIGVGF